MEFCKVTLTFESTDEILWCDHSNETSPPELTHGPICLSKFHEISQNEIWTFGRICFFAKFGSERIQEISGDQSGEFVCGYQGLKG